MNISKIIGVLLIIISLGIGYVGINKLSDSTKEVNLLGIKIDASNESGQTQGVIYLGLAALVFAGGLYSLKTKVK
ncbi:MAG TPA: hypothetical protein VLZ11_07330 [Flavobacterium sp.]|nr:hypothetical protein [Flavobacterium sp.]